MSRAGISELLAIVLFLLVGSRCGSSALFGGRHLLQTNVLPRGRTTGAGWIFRPHRAGGGIAAVQAGPRLEYEGDEPPSRAFIIVDGLCPYHTGYLRARARDVPGVAIINVCSPYLRGYFEQTGDLPDDPTEWESLRMPETPEDLRAWKNVLKNITVAAVYCESDSGLADAEMLRKTLHVACQDDPVVSEARRHKYLMHCAVKAAGLDVAEQKLCETIEEARGFAQQLLSKSDRVVVKPFRGVASESVTLCESLQQVEDAWHKITSTSVFGARETHSNVLVQEFLQGKEYAVDMVSRNGDHKVAAVWRYDKRPANGAAFCYFKTELVDDDSARDVHTVCTYVESALTALGVKWGMSHNEVIVVDGRGPILIEVNCRQHNMDFAPLTMACIGYNAWDMMLVAVLGDEDDWSMFPVMPTLRAYGCMVHLVNYKQGRLRQLFHVQEMAELPSVLDFEVYEHFRTPGEIIEKTIDIRSDAGWAQLINDDAEALQRDYEQIVEWMPTMFYVEEA
jgi:biotin carboxylase